MTFTLANPDRKITIGVVLLDSDTEVLDVAPVDFLAALSKDDFTSDLPLPDSVKAQGLDMEILWINEKGTTARLTGGIRLQPHHSFDSAPMLDIILMGAARASYTPTQSELAYVRKAYESCSAFITICGGMIVPLYAGLLEGKEATAPRMMLDMMKQQAPGVKWVDRRWAKDGKMWTSGTLLNGLDLMTGFVKDTWGDSRKELVAALIHMGHWPDRGVEYNGSEGKMQF